MASPCVSTQCLTFKFRLLPSRTQHAALAEILESQRQLYNAALQERVECWRKIGRGRSYVDQCAALTECRREIPEMAALPLALQRGTIKRVDLAMASFFRRVKAKAAKAGFPRFKGRGWFDSFEFLEFKGIRFDDARLRFAGMPGGLRVHLHRPLPAGAKLLGAKFKRDGEGWHVCLPFRVGTPPEPERIIRLAGVDRGLITLAALSDETLIPNPRHAEKAEREMRRRQRQLARCKRGSKRRAKVRARLARLHAKIRNTRRTHLHQISAALVKQFDGIALEALKVENMKRSAKGTAEAPGTNVKAKSGLNRSIADASWTTLRNFLRYKAERAGRAFAEVDPKRTSQTCPGCGRIEAKPLSLRVHACVCGVSLDRDVAAAQVILQRAVVGPWARKAAGCGILAPGNLGANANSN